MSPNLEKNIGKFLFMPYYVALFVYIHVHLARVYVRIYDKTIESMVVSFVKVLFLQRDMHRWL